MFHTYNYAIIQRFQLLLCVQNDLMLLGYATWVDSTCMESVVRFDMLTSLCHWIPVAKGHFFLKLRLH